MQQLGEEGCGIDIPLDFCDIVLVAPEGALQDCICLSVSKHTKP